MAIPRPPRTYPKKQRVGAYAVIVRSVGGNEEVLLTLMAPRSGLSGRWNLPGGGIDHGEHPHDAVLREVWEETGLSIETTMLLDVNSLHYTGPNAEGVVEDYHAVQVIYEAAVLPQDRDREPVVQEANSSTARAAWVPVADLRSLELLTPAQHGLARYLGV